MNPHHKKRIRRKIQRQLSNPLTWQQNSRWLTSQLWFKKLMVIARPLISAEDIINIQPMNGPIGTTFHLKYVKEDTKSEK